MNISSVQKDKEALTMTITAEVDVPVGRVWQLFADPRQLERWWGPPGYPATFVEHDLSVGQRATYFMTSPEGQKHYGWWEVLAVEPPRRLEVKDGFGDETGAPSTEMPVGRMVVTLSERGGGGTMMVIESHFPSLEAMEQVLAMGQEEGMLEALGQIPAILTDK